MSEAFKELLGRVFDDHHEDLKEALSAEEYARLRFDFVFHMTDWLDDLDRLHDMRSRPESWSTGDATVEMIGMLYHVIPHLKAAGRIYLGEIGDPFEGNEADQLLAKAAAREKPRKVRAGRNTGA